MMQIGRNLTGDFLAGKHFLIMERDKKIQRTLPEPPQRCRNECPLPASPFAQPERLY